jgi:N6-L-threonylcarbamoyladenine synthase
LKKIKKKNKIINMIILAIETSCDDTSVAVVETSDNAKNSKIKFKVLSNVISSQVELHAKWGGVFPSLAKREHEKNLPLVCKQALKEAKNPKIDVIGITIGPGLEPCLWVGINFAKKLAKKMKAPLVPVNHIEAHILANFVSPKLKFQNLNLKNVFPAICLVVSGGHTQIILMRDFWQYEIIGETRDDAAGECFDKIARILGLGYPGGPIISKLAELKTARISLPIKLPRPMMSQKNYDFSFSGLKTAVLYEVKKRGEKTQKSPTYIQRMCMEAQQAITDVLIFKTIKAVKDFGAKTLILGGGVSANENLRKHFKSKIKKDNLKINLLIPEQNLCTDNGVMVAVSAYYNFLEKGEKKPTDIEANANLRLK